MRSQKVGKLHSSFYGTLFSSHIKAHIWKSCSEPASPLARLSYRKLPNLGERAFVVRSNDNIAICDAMWWNNWLKNAILEAQDDKKIIMWGCLSRIIKSIVCSREYTGATAPAHTYLQTKSAFSNSILRKWFPHLSKLKLKIKRPVIICKCTR